MGRSAWLVARSDGSCLLREMFRSVSVISPQSWRQRMRHRGAALLTLGHITPRPARFLLDSCVRLLRRTSAAALVSCPLRSPQTPRLSPSSSTL